MSFSGSHVDTHVHAALKFEFSMHNKNIYPVSKPCRNAVFVELQLWKDVWPRCVDTPVCKLWPSGCGSGRLIFLSTFLFMPVFFYFFCRMCAPWATALRLSARSFVCKQRVQMGFIQLCWCVYIHTHFSLCICKKSVTASKMIIIHSVQKGKQTA